MTKCACRIRQWHMTDIGFLPVESLIAIYIAAYFLRAPRWVRLSIAVLMGVVAAWSLAFGLHIPVPSSVGNPLNQTVPIVAMLIILATFAIRFIRRALWTRT